MFGATDVVSRLPPSSLPMPEHHHPVWTCSDSFRALLHYRPNCGHLFPELTDRSCRYHNRSSSIWGCRLLRLLQLVRSQFPSASTSPSSLHPCYFPIWPVSLPHCLFSATPPRICLFLIGECCRHHCSSIFCHRHQSRLPFLPRSVPSPISW
jgi:hypothetical protein